MRTYLIAAALALAGAAPLLAAAAQTPAASMSTADFAALPQLEDPVLSADGRQIAATATVNGEAKLAILNADRPEAPATLYPVGKGTVAAMRWAGSHRLLLTVQMTQELYGVGEIPFLRLFAIDTPTGAARIVDPKSRGMYAGDVLYTDPSGAWALVASQDDLMSYPSVKRVDLATGQATLVERARHDVWDWYADDKGVLRGGIAYEGRRWTIWYRDNPGEKLRAIRGKVSKDEDSAVDRLIFGPGKDAWIVTNARTGRFGLYKYDVKTGTVGEAVFEHPEVDLDEVVYNSDTDKIIAVNYEDDRQRTLWFDAGRKKLQQKLDKALPDAINRVVDTSADEKRHLVWSGGAADPGAYYLLDSTTSRMHAVINPYERIDPLHLAPVRAVRYPARDGLSLPAYLTLPKGRDPKGLPLIVLPHGGPFSRDSWSYDPLVQFLATRGYAVLQPQFRGSTGYGKSFVERGYGEFGRKMQDDLDDGVDWLARTGQIDPKRVCIVGMSYGGYAAMWGAIRNPERYRCAVSWAGVSDLPALLKYDRRLFSATRYYRQWRSKVAGQGKSDLRAVSPITYAERLKIPILIGHGETDERVPVKQSRAMVNALTKAGARVSSAFYKEAGHDFGSPAELEDWLRRVEQFLRTHNPS